ncbi:hypothetical protein M0813_07490 [Anaeramoeba flamelloides]|uniref:Tyr recombinase domain-containing protein n=1 Tax=Anaeramoeba flamelloides TaxID=1746091 RepID=A0ABQ8XB68_9EUKA|nr:hypothetical protein M0813_07490 [Anaeramoeba flamelloides]
MKIQRPNGIKNDAFYAQPNCNFYKNKTGNWFKRSKLGKNAIYKYFKEIVSSLKEKKIVLHSLRATAISWLEKKGMDFKTIAKISGHRDPRSMEKYLDMGNERKREISNLLSEVKITNGGKEKEIQIRKRKRKNDLNFGEMINGKTNNLHFKFGKTSIQNFSIVNNYASRNRSPKKKIVKIPIRTPSPKRKRNIQEEKVEVKERAEVKEKKKEKKHQKKYKWKTKRKERKMALKSYPRLEKPYNIQEVGNSLYLLFLI